MLHIVSATVKISLHASCDIEDKVSFILLTRFVHTSGLLSLVNQFSSIRVSTNCSMACEGGEILLSLYTVQEVFSPPEAWRYCWRQVAELHVQVDLICFGMSYNAGVKTPRESSLGSSVTLGDNNEELPNLTTLQLLLSEWFCAGKICGSQGSYTRKSQKKPAVHYIHWRLFYLAGDECLSLSAGYLVGPMGVVEVQEPQ